VKQSSVKIHNGVPALFIDGKPVCGAMHWNRFPLAEDVRRFRSAGIDLFSFIGKLSMRKDGASASYDDGCADFPEMTHEMIDQTMEMLVEANPDIKALPRIRITAPDWWKADQPESLIRCYSVRSRRFENGPHVSLGDVGFNRLIAEAIAETITYFETHWGEHILGYHTGLHDCAEHAYRWGCYLGDFGETQLPAFRTWLYGKYQNEAALRRAWGDETLAFETLAFPAFDRFFPVNELDARVIFDPLTDASAVDFLAFASDAMADAVIAQAKLVKRKLHELGQTKIFGAFYGYSNLPPNLIDHYGLGHYALSRIYDCPEIDFICSPIAYDTRQRGGVALPQVLPGSLAVNGKLYYAEDDTRCHLARNHADCVSSSSEQTRDLLLRNFLDVRRTGGTLWWMDLFGEGWFRDDAFIPLFRELKQIEEETIGSLRSNAEIAVFVSETSRLYERCAPVPIAGNLVCQELNEIAAIGTAFDLYRLEDLPALVENGLLPQYKFCVMLNALALSETLRAAIKRHLQCGNRTLLWFYLPGYVRNGKADSDAASDLTGIELASACNLRTSLITETWLDGRRVSYGHPRNISPRLVGCDAKADNLGFYVEGVGSDHPETGNGSSLVSKRFPDWRSIWSASPNMPSCLLTTFAREAGVHLYTSQGDQVFTMADLLGINAKFSGVHEIALPQPTTVIDRFTGEIVSSAAKCFRITMERGECRLFRLVTGSLNPGSKTWKKQQRGKNHAEP